MKRIVTAVLLLMALALSISPAQNKIVGTYLTSWSLNCTGLGSGTDGAVPYNQIDFGTFDYLIMFAGATDGSGNLSHGNLAQGTGSPRMKPFNDWVHANHPSKAVLYSIGGSSNSEFPSALASATSRTALVNNFAAMITNYHYDGIDIDNEYDTSPANMGAFVNELYVKFQTLTAFYSPGAKPWITVAMTQHEVDDYSGCYDKINILNVMTYDLSAGQGWGWHNQATRSRNDAGAIINKDSDGYEAASVEKRFGECVKVIPASKLGMMTSTNGHYWSGGTGPRTSSGSVSEDRKYNFPYSNLGGYTYAYVNSGISSGRRKWDAVSQSCYIVDADGSGWLSYEDPESIDSMVALGFKKGGGGFCSWGYGEGWDPSHTPKDFMHRAMWDGVQKRQGNPPPPPPPQNLTVTIAATATQVTVNTAINVSATVNMVCDSVIWYRGLTGATVPVLTQYTTPFNYSFASSVVGSFEMFATAYKADKSTKSNTVTIQVSVTPPPPEPQKITKLFLAQSATQAVVPGHDPLTDGAVIDLAKLGTSLNIFAVTNPATVGSVQWYLNGSALRFENTPPYGLGGDYGEMWQIASGSYTLTATPYTVSGGQSGGGIAGTSLTIRFTATTGEPPPPEDCDSVLYYQRGYDAGYRAGFEAGTGGCPECPDSAGIYNRGWNDARDATPNTILIPVPKPDPK